ncbi:MAG TPA: hypothetical protein VMH83_04550 [Candidatus Acidoferrum sp.]|nr:hypothetical protein [Candidatus Acidoferrum sp.]
MAAAVTPLKSFALAAALSLAVPPAVLAHSASATMDPAGNTPTFTGLARVTCFDDGSGPPALLYAHVRDNSPPVNGLLVNLQILKGTQALSITDPVSGDANYSDALQLQGGAGVYTLILNKTATGARSFDIEYHCLTAAGDHTGTDIIVDQFK